MFEWLSDKKSKMTDEPTDWAKVSDAEIIDGLLGPERRPVVGRPSSGHGEREVYRSKGEPSPIKSPTLRPGPMGHIQDAEVAQMKDRLIVVNKELNDFWDGEQDSREGGASLVDLVRERGEIERGLGRFGISIDDVDKEIAEEQAPLQQDTTPEESLTNDEDTDDLHGTPETEFYPAEDNYAIENLPDYGSFE